jgi:hypothetical protein
MQGRQNTFCLLDCSRGIFKVTGTAVSYALLAALLVAWLITEPILKLAEKLVERIKVLSTAL